MSDGPVLVVRGLFTCLVDSIRECLATEFALFGGTGSCEWELGSGALAEGCGLGDVVRHVHPLDEGMRRIWIYRLGIYRLVFVAALVHPVHLVLLAICVHE